MEQGLHLKYRPSVLSEMVGNETTMAALAAVLDRPAGPPHAVLFAGPRGCGKTTLARIYGYALGVEARDFHEQNAADFRGIDSIREMRAAMKYRPIQGNASVWLLDECHQLSKDAQNALLKMLEDTPPHAYIVLATTDPNKLIDTVQSRCMRFDVELLSHEDIVTLLRSIPEANGISEDVLERIARDSLGSPRGALVVLDKIYSLPADQQLAAAEHHALVENQTIELCRALLKGAGWKVIAGILKGLNGEEPEGIRRAVLGYCASVLMSGQPKAYLIMSCFDKPYYDIGRPGLVMSCFEACAGK